MQGFTIFLETLNPEPFLSLGSTAIDNISQISMNEFSRISKNHIEILINCLFIKSDEITTGNPYLAFQLLTHINNIYPEKNYVKDTLDFFFEILNEPEINHTSAGYIYQMLKPTLLNKNNFLLGAFIEVKNINLLVKHIYCTSIVEILKIIILQCPEICQVIIYQLVMIICKERNHTVSNCCDVIKSFLDTSSPDVIINIFTTDCILGIFNSIKITGKYALSVLYFLLTLPNDLIPTSIVIRIISENINQLHEILQTAESEIKIWIIKILTIAIEKNLRLIHYAIGDSLLILDATVINK